MKKLKIMILLIILSFSFFLLTYFKKRSYEVTYKKSGYNINEKYDKKNNYYLINVTDKSSKYTFISKSDYSRKRKLISEVTKYEEDDSSCILVKFNGSYLYPECKKKNEAISYHLLSNKIKNKIEKKYKVKTVEENIFNYKNINVYSLNNKQILIWNYSGFYNFENKKAKDIKVFKKEEYNPPFIGLIDNYIIIPDYESGYEFNKVKVLNTKNQKIETIELNDSLSSDTYVLGRNNESIFIYDKKYHTEYEIVPHKLKYRTVSPMVYKNGELVKKKTTYLDKGNATFIYDSIYDFKIINNKLYKINNISGEKELISNLDVKEIVNKSDNEVYYISSNKLYMYSNKTGEVLLLEYFELNFNYKNIIFVI